MKSKRFAPKRALGAHGIASATFDEDNGWFLRFNDACGVLLRVNENGKTEVDWILEHGRDGMRAPK